MAVWQLEKTTLLFYDMDSLGAEPSLVFPLSPLGKLTDLEIIPISHLLEDP